jgi:hypothetical protein
LELLRDHGGTEVGWNEWKEHVVIPSRPPGTRAPRAVQVSGCRLIFVDSTATGSGYQMEVFDFSMQGRAKYSNERTNQGARQQ